MAFTSDKLRKAKFLEKCRIYEKSRTMTFLHLSHKTGKTPIVQIFT